MNFMLSINWSNCISQKFEFKKLVCASMQSQWILQQTNVHRSIHIEIFFYQKPSTIIYRNKVLFLSFTFRIRQKQSTTDELPMKNIDKSLFKCSINVEKQKEKEKRNLLFFCNFCCFFLLSKLLFLNNKYSYILAQ